MNCSSHAKSYLFMFAMKIMRPSQIVPGLRAIPNFVRVDGAPKDLNDIPGHAGDKRTLENLFNGVNTTVDDSNMWIAPLRHWVEDGNFSKHNEITIEAGNTINPRQ